MKLERKETIDGKTVITISRRFLFWHKIEEYEAVRAVVPGKYWEWVKLPNRTIIPDTLSFQLDSWNRN